MKEASDRFVNTATTSELSNALAQGDEAAHALLSRLTEGLSPEQLLFLQQTLPLELSGDTPSSPSRLQADVRAAVGQMQAVEVSGDPGLTALATGDARLMENRVAAGLSDDDTQILMRRLAEGAEPATVWAEARQTHSEQVAIEARIRVESPVSTGFMEALARGEVDDVTSQKQGEADGFVSSLATGASSEQAGMEAEQAGNHHAIQFASATVPLHPADQAAQSLAASDLIPAHSDHTAVGLATVLADGVVPLEALASAHQALAAQASLSAASTVPLTPSDQAIHALASGEHLETVVTSGTAQVLAQLLAAGNSSADSTTQAQVAGSLQTQQVMASSVPLSASDQIGQALATPEGHQGIDISEGAIIAQALAEGHTPQHAVAEARLVAEAKAAQMAASANVPVGAVDRLISALASGKDVHVSLASIGLSPDSRLGVVLAGGMNAASALKEAREAALSREGQLAQIRAFFADFAEEEKHAVLSRILEAVLEHPGLHAGEVRAHELPALHAFQLQPLTANASFIAELQGLIGVLGRGGDRVLASLHELALTQTMHHGAWKGAALPIWLQESTHLILQALMSKDKTFFATLLTDLGNGLEVRLHPGEALHFTPPPRVVELMMRLGLHPDIHPLEAYPSWLHIDSGKLFLSGVPGVADVGILHFMLSLSNIRGEILSRTVSLTVEANNQQPPVFLEAMPLDESTLLIRATDADPGAVLGITASSLLPAWMVLTDHGDGTATLGGKPGHADAGHYSITLTVSDGLYRTGHTFEFDIRTVPDEAPVFSGAVPVSVTAGEVYRYVVTGYDAEGDPLHYTAAGLPAWLSLKDQGDGTALLEGVPDKTDAGAHTITLTLGDGQLEVTQTYTLTVALPPDVVQPDTAPELTSTAPVTVTVGETYRYLVTGRDADPGDTLSYTAAGLPAWLSLKDQGDGTALLEGVPDKTDAGAHTITLTLGDGQLEVTQTYTLTVALPPDVVQPDTAPELTSTAPVTVTVGETYRYLVTGRDADPGDTLSYTAAGLPAWLSLKDQGDGTALLEGVPDKMDAGAHTITLTLGDGQLEVTQTYTLTVALPPDVVQPDTAPELTSTAPVTVTVGETYRYLVTGRDADPGDTLSYTAAGLPGWLSLKDQGDGTALLEGVPDKTDAGAHTITLTLGDGQLEVTQTYTLTVALPPDVVQPDTAPELTSTAPVTVTVGETYRYLVTGRDADSGDTLSYTAADLPAWLSLKDQGDGTALLEGVPDKTDAGAHTITLTLGDGQLEATQTYTLTVALPPDVVQPDTAPELTSTAPVTVTVGETYRYLVTGRDAEGDPLHYTTAGLPGWLSLKDQGDGTALLEGVPDKTDAGVHTITLTLGDGQLEVTQTYTLTVEIPPNTPPAFTSTASTTVRAGDTYRYAITLNDADTGDTLSIAASGLPDWLTLTDLGGGSALLTGQPTASDRGDHVIRLTGSDGELLTEQMFTLSVSVPNAAPSFTSLPVEDASEGQAYEYLIRYTDPDGLIGLTLAAADLPAWLSLTDYGDGTARLSGTPANDQAGVFPVELRLNDGTLTVTQRYPLTVANVDLPPVAEADTATVRSGDSAVEGNVLDNDHDVDAGDSLSVRAGTTTGQYGALTLDAGGHYRYVLDTARTAVIALGADSPPLTDVFKVTVQDAEGLSATATLTVSIQGANDAPVTTLVLEPLRIEAGQVLRYSVPANAWTDPEGESLTYAASLADGGALPAWLHFDPATLSLSGTPAVADVTVATSLVLDLSATDPEGASSHLSLNVLMQPAPLPVNQPPIAHDDTQTTTETDVLDIPTSAGVLANDADPDAGDSLTVSAVNGMDAQVGMPMTLSGGGILTLNRDGAYRFDPGTAYRSLSGSETATETVTYTADDGHGGTSEARLRLTVQGSNDAPALADGSLFEGRLDAADTGTTKVQGTLIYVDPEPGDSLTLTRQVKSVMWTGGSLKPDQGALLDTALTLDTPTLDKTTGQTLQAWTFTLPASRFDFLQQGETLTAVYTVMADDGHGGKLDQDVTITVTGANDLPLLVKEGTVPEAAYTEIADTTASTSAVSLKGQLNVSDADVNDTLTATHAVKSLVWSGGDLSADQQARLGKALTLEASATGKTQQPWMFTAADADFDFLKAGETLTAVYTVTLDDGHGGKLDQEVTITVTGTNDRPTLVKEGTVPEAAYTEIADTTASTSAVSLKGQLSVSDADVNDGLTATHAVKSLVWSGGDLSADRQASLGKALTLDASAGRLQAWTFTAADADFDFLKADETLTAVYRVTLNDGYGGKLDQNVTITVTGSNDVPMIVADQTTATARYTEREASLSTGTVSTAMIELQGDVVFRDADVNDTHTFTQTVKSFTGSGGTLTEAQKDSFSKAMSLAAPIDSKGTGQGKQPWIFRTPDSSLDFLAAGETLIAVYTLTIADALNAKAEQDVTLTLTGINDLPVIMLATGDSNAASLTEANGGLDAKGSLNVTDPDVSNTVSPAVVSVVASGVTAGMEHSNSELLAMMSVDTMPIISATATTGTLHWAFDSHGEAFDYLAKNETLTLTYTLKVTDSSSGTASQDVVISIQGANDPPVITYYNNIASINETDTGLSASGYFTVRDADHSDVIDASNPVVSIAGTTVGLTSSTDDLRNMLTVGFKPVTDSTSTTGVLNWNFNSGAKAFNYLAQGESLILTYTVLATDLQAATASQSVVITINGTNDAPVIGSDPGISGVIAENGTSISGTIPFIDKDWSDTHTATWSLKSLSYANFAALTDAQKTAVHSAMGSTTTTVVSGSDGTLVTGVTATEASRSSAFSLESWTAAGTTSTDSTGTGQGSQKWIFTQAASVFDFLTSGETLTGVYAVTFTDQQGASITQDVTIRVTGVNDAPTFPNTPPTISLTDTAYTDTVYSLTANGSNLSGALYATATGSSSLIYGIESGTSVASTAAGGSVTLTYDIFSTGSYGTLYLSSSTGSYNYVPNADAIDPLSYGSYSERFRFTATTPDGLTGYTDLTVNVTGADESAVTTPTPTTTSPTTAAAAPITLDLTGNGLGFTALQDTQARFDFSQDGLPDRTAWVAPDDGFLAYDANHDGNITQRSEIVFTDYAPDAGSDMAAVRWAFDTNGDAWLSPQDADWMRFGVWQDINGNGVSDTGEFRRLDDFGIQRINLQAEGETTWPVEGVTLHGSSRIEWADGHASRAGDVSLGFEINEAEVLGQALSDRFTSTVMMDAELAASIQRFKEAVARSGSGADTALTTPAQSNPPEPVQNPLSPSAPSLLSGEEYKNMLLGHEPGPSASAPELPASPHIVAHVPESSLLINNWQTPSDEMFSSTHGVLETQHVM